MEIYQYSFVDNKGNNISLSDYKDKTLLLVNTASRCGKTPQYKGLQDLYEKYNNAGLEIIAFPCNQFGEQEPGTDEEINNFCSTNYGVTFKIATKCDVNGEAAIPLYQYLTKTFKNGRSIDWNFEKFLVDKNGTIHNIDHQVNPEDIEGRIKESLGL